MHETELKRRLELKAAMRVYLLALIIGLGVGTLGSAFHYTVQTTSEIFNVIAKQFSDHKTLAVSIAAVLGALMVGISAFLVRRYAPEAAGSGIQEIEGIMSGLRPLRWRQLLPIKFFGGVLSMGAGLVLGREGPTIHLGGCVGQIVGEKANSNEETMNTLLAAGATAGLSVAFSAPLGAILFMIEEMRRRFKYNFVSLHAVILASITANTVNDQVFGTLPQLPVQLQTWLPKFPPPENLLTSLPFHLLLGALIGALGAGFNTVLLKCLRISDRLNPRTMQIIACSVGAVAGALMVVAPEYVGGGEALVKEIFDKSPVLGFLLALLIVRAILTFLSYSMGVPGGIFAPMLALGALIGTIFGNIAQELAPHAHIYPGSCAIAAMGALFAATVRAPLTGIVLVAEMTASFNLLPAMIITCMTASVVAQSLGSKPVYDMLLERTLEGDGIREE
ncbi:H(+)/Cl(-) exchange transporter ClcA [Gimesia alba]|uniref:H(+)/Cl(-) exchange transporter ClcA n=1 Tax=Gimesia alba TaxID=2527973 RepID=A0A517RPS1_9PLAN|nr:H(+)/Cl(-) exchange transporter ClcA [Gimesia alba]QDT45879.1 H(+)/Cl(-) exchange transporter ClcA [Gimesia alba]